VWFDGVRVSGDGEPVLLDPKDRYAQFIDFEANEFFEWYQGEGRLLDEASRQNEAARANGGTPIEWRISDPRTAEFFRTWLRDRGITGIRVVYQPRS
jgi:hypothetical protein